MANPSYRSSSVMSADTLISIYKQKADTFRDMLKPYFEKCQEEGLIPRIFLDIRGSYINVHGKEGKELCRRYLYRQEPVYSRGIIEIVNNWCKIFQGENMHPVIVPFGEFGESRYHLALEKKYKEHRRQRDMISCGEELCTDASVYVRRELLNLDWIFSTRGTNVCSLISEDLEFDVAPKLIIDSFPKHKTIHPDNGSVIEQRYFNIILSKDKDFAQVLSENTIQITKIMRGDYTLINEENFSSVLLKMKKNIPPKWVSLALAMIGDSSDGYDGIKGCGEVLAGEFIAAHHEEMDAIEGKDSYRKFRKFIESNARPESKSFAKIKKLYDIAPKAAFKSYLLADFEALINGGNFRSLMEKHREKYERVIFCQHEPEKLAGKKDFLIRQFGSRYKMVSEMTFYHIVTNTRK